MRLAIITDPTPALAWGAGIFELPAGAYPVVDVHGAGPEMIYLTGPDGKVAGIDRALPGVTLANAGDPFHNPALPPELLVGFVVGECGHRVAGSEWRAGYRTCERCPA